MLGMLGELSTKLKITCLSTFSCALLTSHMFTRNNNCALLAKLNVTSCVLNQNMKITGSLHRILLQLYIKKLQNKKKHQTKQTAQICSTRLKRKKKVALFDLLSSVTNTNVWVSCLDAQPKNTVH